MAVAHPQFDAMLPWTIPTTSLALSCDFTSSKTKHLPGYGRDLNLFLLPHDPGYLGEPLRNGLELDLMDDRVKGARLPILRVKELEMLRFMSYITDIPQWSTTIHDPAALRGWKMDAMTTNDFKGMTERMVDWCFEELKQLAVRFDKDVFGVIPVYNGGVVKSDKAVLRQTREGLVHAVKVLEDVPSKDKDWQPGSFYKVVNLVDPGLSPLVYGRTKILGIGEDVLTMENCITKCGMGSPIPVPVEHSTLERIHNGEVVNAYSSKSQWLPCNVDIGTGTAKILTYINNLHPQYHASLYRMIEDVISAAIPLWDATLAPLADFNYVPKRRINRRREKFWQDRSKQTPAKHAAMQAEFTPANKPCSFSLIERYGRKGIPLQIIVRMESIELTPKKSKYFGGKWHLEGQMNEHIVATAIYDYSTENIMPSNISFRQRWKDDVLEDELIQTMADGAEFPLGWYKTYRVNQYQPQIQWVGSVEMKQGRLISYPNILQNKVEPVTLQNIQQPGHRKMLILYLVDPNVRIISTAEVPWQRFSTWREGVTEGVIKPGLHQQARVGLHRLPAELLELVFQEIEPSPITMKEAKDTRIELIKERAQLVSEHVKVFGSMSESSSPF